jgi:hypothetical protein
MTELEKVAYAVVMASCKLRHYFEAFKLWVTSDRGLGELFRNPEASVRIAKWATELFGYHITFEPRTAIKSQVLADFIVDWTGPITQPDTSTEKVWTIHCDGAWCHAGAGAAAVITQQRTPDLCSISRLSAVSRGNSKVSPCSTWTEPRMRRPTHWPRQPARGEALPSDVFYHVIGTPAVRSLEGLQITNDSEGHRIVNLIMTEDWRAPITLFLQGYYHPTDINEAKRLKHQSRDFTLIAGQLYKKGVSQPMLKCVTETEGIQILREVHSGTCGSHAWPRALDAKVIRQGFYWPAMICAANRVTRSCEAYHKFSPRSGSPSQFTKLITHTWPLQR